MWEQHVHNYLRLCIHHRLQQSHILLFFNSFLTNSKSIFPIIWLFVFATPISTHDVNTFDSNSCTRSFRSLLSLEPTNDGFSCRDTKQRDLPKHFDPIYFENQTIELENKEGKKFSGIYIEEGKPSDPLHTPALNKIMACVREHR